MFSKPSSISNIEKLKKLLNEKYHDLEVNVTSDSDNIKITLTNGRNGLYDSIDEENIRPIQFLEAFGAKVSKEKAKHSYWSYSVIALQKEKLSQVIDGLEKLPTPKVGQTSGKIMAMC